MWKRLGLMESKMLWQCMKRTRKEKKNLLSQAEIQAQRTVIIMFES